MVLKRFNLTVMKKITVLSGLLLLAGLAAQAQERVAEYNVRPAVTVRTPLQGDSINFKGDKFTTGNLLKTKVSLDFDGGRYGRQGQSVLSVCYQSACGAFHEGQAECIFSCPF